MVSSRVRYCMDFNDGVLWVVIAYFCPLNAICHTSAYSYCPNYSIQTFEKCALKSHTGWNEKNLSSMIRAESRAEPDMMIMMEDLLPNPYFVHDSLLESHHPSFDIQMFYLASYKLSRR